MATWVVPSLPGHWGPIIGHVHNYLPCAHAPRVHNLPCLPGHFLEPPWFAHAMMVCHVRMMSCACRMSPRRRGRVESITPYLLKFGNSTPKMMARTLGISHRMGVVPPRRTSARASGRPRRPPARPTFSASRRRDQLQIRFTLHSVISVRKSTP